MKSNKKGKKLGKSDLIYAKKSKVITRKENPFELHVNREKFNVLNRKTNHSFGKPLISRQNAFEKRKQTIGAEYNVKNKTNQFDDRRKMGNRKIPKESIYNLNDSEKLTHRGQTLEEIEQFDDIVPDEEEEEMSDEEARLDANFTKVAHFGGGDGETMKDRKTAIDELIADSKKRKAERMKEHEEMLDLTNKLDNDWKDLISVVKTLERTETPDKPEPDDYDRLVKEMIFSPRGEPTVKLKSEEEIARIEKEKLENLEMLRLKRMQGDDENVVEGKSNYRSADDLDDGYFLEPVMADENEEDGKVLSYPINGEVTDQNVDEYEEDDDENVDEEEGNDENIEEEKENNESSEAEESGDSEDESEADSLEDLKADDSESDENEEIPEVNLEKNEKKNVEPIDSIPFTISLPNDYECFLELLSNQSIKVQCTIIERIIKTNHPKLHFSNKNKMFKLFVYILQYVNDLFTTNDESSIAKHFKLIHSLSPYLFDLVQMNPEECSESFLEVIKEKYEEFKKNPKVFPKLDTLIFFRFIDALFPTSDFRHPVVTPCYIFLHHILSQSRIKNRYDISSGLYLVTLSYDHQKISKRFLPSVLNFLRGICYMGVKKSIIENLKPIPPFKRMDNLLVVGDDFESSPTSNSKDQQKIAKLMPLDFITSTLDDDFKLRALNTACGLIKDFIKLYENVIGVQYLIDSFSEILNRLLEEEKLPSEMKESVKETLKEFDRIKSEKKFKYPEPERKILPMLRQLEPKFEAVHTDRRQMYCQSKGNAAEKKKLQHMLKREKKAAKRELIRDSEFISKIRHKRKQQMDIERKEKVRMILHEGSLQQSEFKALSRTKGRKGIF